MRKNNNTLAGKLKFYPNIKKDSPLFYGSSRREINEQELNELQLIMIRRYDNYCMWYEDGNKDRRV
jgi:hypothetical protein